MRLHQQERTLKTSELQETSNFRIKATAKAFRILIDGLYSNKPEAIVRELSSNAFDSHTQAGKQTVPFDVHLPNRLEPWLEIRDYGVGLSHDMMMHLYVTIFDTNKDDTNDVTGGLGLGGKSPFSYVSSFTVTSLFDGDKRVYSCYLDEIGQPKISLIHSEPTREGNGLSVKMQIKSEDVNTFVASAKKVYKRYDPLPNISGNSNFEIEQVKYIVEGSFWKVRKEKSSGYRYNINYTKTTNEAMAIQGTVAYPINHATINPSSDKVISVLNMPIDIDFAIGDLDITPSRESLSYDALTIKNIVNKCELIYQEILDNINAEFKACKTLYEARLHLIKAEELIKYYPNSILSDITFDGKKVERNMNFATHQQPNYNSVRFPKTYVHEFSGRAYSWGKHEISKSSPRLNSCDNNNHSTNTGENDVFLLDDIEKGLGPHVRWLLDENILPSDTDYIYIFRDTTKKEIEKLLKYLGDIPISKLYVRSELKEKPRATTANGLRSTYVPVKKYNGGSWNYHKSYMKNNWDSSSIKLEDGGIYVPLLEGNADYEFYNVMRAYSICVKYKPIIPAVTIYGIPGTSRRKKFDELVAQGVWKDYRTIIKDWTDSELILNKKNIDVYYMSSEYPVPDSIKALVQSNKIKDKNNLVYKFSNNIVTLSEDTINYIKYLLELAKELNINLDSYTPKGFESSTKLMKEMNDKYKLLGMFNVDENESNMKNYRYHKPIWQERLDDLVEYINLIDSQKGS